MTYEQYATQKIADIQADKDLGPINVDYSIEHLEENLKLLSSLTPPLLAFDGDLILAYSPRDKAWYVWFTPKTGALNATAEVGLTYEQARTLFDNIIVRVRDQSNS